MNIKDFFYLQKNDQQAILVLASIFLACLCIVFVVGNTDDEGSEKSPHDTPTYAKNKNTAQQQDPLYYKVEEKIYELFPFDPNTADSTDFLRLGLQPWQVRSIYRYRAKGGIYRKATDFAKLFGLTKKQYEALAPYIQIANDYRPASDFYGNKREYAESYHETYKKGDTNNSKDDTNNSPVSYPHKLEKGQHIAINTADTTELMKIPGIGNYYAKRIIRYRDLLGGFTSSHQLSEIEGVPESAQAYINIDIHHIKKLDINKLSLNQLRKHPYINFYQAKAICDYRRLRGPIKDLEELKLLNDFPAAEIERLRPYVSF